MASTSQIYINEELKHQAEAILKAKSITLEKAIEDYLGFIIETGKYPFTVSTSAEKENIKEVYQALSALLDD